MRCLGLRGGFGFSIMGASGVSTSPEVIDSVSISALSVCFMSTDLVSTGAVSKISGCSAADGSFATAS